MVVYEMLNIALLGLMLYGGSWKLLFNYLSFTLASTSTWHFDHEGLVPCDSFMVNSLIIWYEIALDKLSIHLLYHFF